MGKPATIEFADGAIIDVSVYMKEEHSLKLTPTKNKVEQGVDITDHIKKEPDEITVTGITSDFDMSLSSAYNSVKSLIKGGKHESKSNATIKAFEERFGKNRELVTIITNDKTYVNMSLREFRRTTDINNSYSVEFTASFIEIRIIKDAEIVGQNLAGQNSLLADAAKKKGQGVAADFKKKTKDLTDKLDKAMSSPKGANKAMLKHLKDALLDLVSGF